MAQHRASESPLVAAARALERELEEFALRADQIKRGALTTQRQIERARELAAGVPAAEASLCARIAALERAVQATDAGRAQQAAWIAERTPHIEARAAELQRLLDVWAGLGVRVSQRPNDAPTLAALAREIDALLVEARSGDFPDVVSLAEALAKSVGALRPKV